VRSNVPVSAHAVRIAVTSACAVGSLFAVTRLRPSNTRPSAVTMMAPNGPPPSWTFLVARSVAFFRYS
jgi:hypothetical protein